MLQFNSLQKEHFRIAYVLQWAIFILAWISITDNYAASTKQSQLEAVEIAGISLNTPADRIAAILQAQGYTQVNASLYTKEEPLQNGRSAIYRIEIENNPVMREISYSRSLSGGRIKSPTLRDAPIPDSDMDMVQQLYRAVCLNISETLQKERGCEPYSSTNIIAGNGQPIEIDNHFTVFLKATDANTAIGIKYSK